MKPHISSRWTAPVLAGIGCLLIHPLFAQTLTTLHALTQPGLYPPGTNDEGSTPKAKLLVSDNTLYGTAAFGGSGGYGTIFKMSPDGTGFVILHSFEPIVHYTNSEGGMPYGGLTLSGDTLYGEALLGGPSDCGTLFKLNTNGTGYTVLYSFTGRSDSSGPLGGLVQSGNTLYGTTAWFGGTGGYSQSGTVFALAADGSNFKTIYHFSATMSETNLDGSRPISGVIVSGNTLYGTTQKGGIEGNGTVFALSTDGSSFRVLHTFGAIPNIDGANPASGVTSSGNTLYGTTQYGGSFGGGTIYKLSTNGSGFATLYSFPSPLPSDVIGPSDLALIGNSLYGTTERTIFKINTDGSGFTTLYSFVPVVGTYQTNLNGAFPWADMSVAGNLLYGTTSAGGIWGNGTIFSFSLPVARLQPTITQRGQNIVLAWPANGMTLQSTTDLTSPAWTTVTSPAGIVNGQNVLTNPIAGAKQFFRLSQ
jgi:uncharacterized repeat protein (TIGR03803 family)